MPAPLAITASQLKEQYPHVPIYSTPKDCKGRISGNLKYAIGLMIFEGLKRAEAATSVGMTDHGLYSALTRPHVKRYKNKVLRAFMEAEAERSFVRTARIAEGASSEHVKLEANKTIMSMDDRFIQKTQVNQVHSGEVRVTPGYVIDLSEEEHMTSNHVIDAEIVEEKQQDS